MAGGDEKIDSVPKSGGDAEYAAIMERAMAYVERLYASDDCEWDACKETDDGIRVVRRRSTQWAGHVFRTTVTLPFSPSATAVMLHPDGPYRVVWDPTLKEVRRVKQIDASTAIHEHILTPLFAGLISSRASLDLVRYVREGPVYKLYAVSTELAGHTVDEKHVRGWMYPSGLRFAPSVSKGPSHTDATVLFQTDPRLRLVPRSVHEALVPANMLNWLAEWRTVGAQTEVDKELVLLGGWRLDA